MNAIKTLLLAGVVTAALAGNAGAAVFAKYDGVDGESKATAACADVQSAARHRQAGGASKRASSEDAATCATAYGKDGKKGGNVETTWKVEEGE
ncbi:hypothetical protein [Hyphococcus sp.]|uniref:hypothetical protein n=1 Tax=Hyphococcus sp. TaxID=2038636 RepID=UPI0035C678BC